MKEDLYEFIKLKTPNLKEVLDFSIKKCDDEEGAIGEHYIVRCILLIPDSTSTVFTTIESKRTCLVDRQEFQKWKRKEDSIRWVN